MNRRLIVLAAAPALAVAMTAGAAAPLVPNVRPTPYWASLSANEARMRTGPGRTYPASWVYQRSGLPMQVIEVYPGWRKVRDPDGTEGWMIANLLSAQRTAIVRDAEVMLRDAPASDAHVAWRAEPGAVGKLSRCSAGWCRFDAAGRAGFVETEHLWGVERMETID
jgi:SH3-like domain-containing protein